MRARCCHTWLQAFNISISCACQTTMSIPVAILAPQAGFIYVGWETNSETPRGQMTSPYNECVNDLVREFLEMLGDGEA